jgi:hypothetical protein
MPAEVYKREVGRRGQAGPHGEQAERTKGDFVDNDGSNRAAV